MSNEYTVEKIRSFRHNIEEMALEHQAWGENHSEASYSAPTPGLATLERQKASTDLLLSLTLRAVGDLASLLLEVADGRESDKEVAALMTNLRGLEDRLKDIESRREDPP